MTIQPVLSTNLQAARARGAGGARYDEVSRGIADGIEHAGVVDLDLMTRTQSRDASGFGVFSHGDLGRAHVTAHRMLDEGRHELGHKLLGRWIERNDGTGSDWTHLQWHMAVFEIAVGQWEHALARFEREILPVAAHTDDALTDAPALLWRLALSAPQPPQLDWEPVRRRALHNLRRSLDPYVELHCLLALAGAADLDNLDRWLWSKHHDDCPRTKLVARLGIGLRALAAGDYELAASLLDTAAPRVSELGGSRAQNELFTEIAALSWALARSRAAA